MMNNTKKSKLYKKKRSLKNKYKRVNKRTRKQKGGKDDRGILKKTVVGLAKTVVGVTKLALSPITVPVKAFTKKSCKKFYEGKDPKRKKGYSKKRLVQCEQKINKIKSNIRLMSKDINPTFPESYSNFLEIKKKHNKIMSDRHNRFIPLLISLKKRYGNVIKKKGSHGFRLAPTKPNKKRKKKLLTLLGYKI
jgi:hypothetical protein